MRIDETDEVRSAQDVAMLQALFDYLTVRNLNAAPEVKKVQQHFNITTVLRGQFLPANTAKMLGKESNWYVDVHKPGDFGLGERYTFPTEKDRDEFITRHYPNL